MNNRGSASPAGFHPEEPHQLLQLLRLAAHLFRRRREFFRRRSILLRDLVELVHRGVDLADAGRLLFGGGFRKIRQLSITVRELTSHTTGIYM